MTARVLVVEDEGLIQRLLLTVFVRRGLEVEATGDGADALERIRTGRFGVVVLDLMLPGLSGYEILEACASLTGPRPVFLVTTAFDAGFIRRLDPGMVAAVITKPFDITTLTALVRELAETWPDRPAALPQARGAFSPATTRSSLDAEPAN